jgi:hypothetical protein
LAFEHKITTSLIGGGSTEPLSGDVTITGNNKVSFDETLTSLQSNLELAAAFDKDAVLSIYILSEKDCLIETNSSSAPDDTIELVGGEPFRYNSHDPDTWNPFGADVTKLFATNEFAGTNRLRIEILLDGTPGA